MWVSPAAATSAESSGARPACRPRRIGARDPLVLMDVGQLSGNCLYRAVGGLGRRIFFDASSRKTARIVRFWASLPWAESVKSCKMRKRARHGTQGAQWHSPFSKSLNWPGYHVQQLRASSTNTPAYGPRCANVSGRSSASKVIGLTPLRVRWPPAVPVNLWLIARARNSANELYPLFSPATGSASNST